jgi:HD-like signal output (HDOD) protein
MPRGLGSAESGSCGLEWLCCGRRGASERTVTRLSARGHPFGCSRGGSRCCAPLFFRLVNHGSVASTLQLPGVLTQGSVAARRYPWHDAASGTRAPVKSGDAFITAAPLDVEGWARVFDAASLPVLQSSATILEAYRQNEDAIDAHMLAEALSHDPLMTLKILAHVAHVRRGREGTDAETLTAALVMLGIGPFFRDFGPQPIVEERLAGMPLALDGFNAVLERSHRAARFALAFAVQRMDHDAAVIHEAALLHDFVDLLLWLTAPTLAEEVRARQRAEPGLRTSSAQMAVFHVALPALQHALMVKWGLPRLLIDIADDEQESVSSQARSVLLAIRLARHTAGDWENPALGDDIRDISALLRINTDATLALLRDVDS